MDEGRRLVGKVAVITGAGKGIGAATARLFARHGAVLGLIDRDGEALDALAQEITENGGQVYAVTGDVSHADDVASLVTGTKARFGLITILVNNAGMTITRPFMDSTMEDVDLLVGVNLKGLILTSQAVIPHMIEAGGGAIVHDASNAGLVGRPWQPIYGATKAGIISLTKSMALAHAAQRIRVNCICPGSIDTPMLRSALSASGHFDDNWRRTSMVIPLGRIGEAEDVARATLFLASDEASYITGAALPVDGGRTAGIAETFHLTMEETSRNR